VQHQISISLGMGQEYTKAAILLTSLYVCFCLAGILEEVAGLFEAAPQKYIHDPGTTDIRALAALVPSDFPYFWFLFNEAPLYDKFKFHRVNDQALKTYASYQDLPSELVTFDLDIYGHLQSVLGGWSNRPDLAHVSRVCVIAAV
jgi:hypothetical protein